MTAQTPAMLQVLFQPQKHNFEDFIKPIHSFKRKGRPREVFAKAIFYRHTSTYIHMTHSEG